MSVKKKLEEKTAGVVNMGMSKVWGQGAAVQQGATHTPKTAVGAMMETSIYRKEADAKLREAQVIEAKFNGATPAKLFDSKIIVPSKWANRNELSYQNDDFLALKKEIESAGGNVQPIKVRPLKGAAGLFEIVFGHRRHRACLDLNLPILALVDDLSDADLFTQMDRENRQRADLRPYEQGVMYAKALDDGLFPSMRKMAEQLGVEVGNASKYIAIAKLPADVLAAFKSPLDVKQIWATPLRQALQKSPEAVIACAKEMKVLFETTRRPNASEIAKSLINSAGVVSNNTPSKEPFFLKGNGDQTGEIHYNPRKKTFSISLVGLDEGKLDEIKKAIKNLIA